jgi:hypothetical protein
MSRNGFADPASDIEIGFIGRQLLNRLKRQHPQFNPLIMGGHGATMRAIPDDSQFKLGRMGSKQASA